jgi:hypothetical protein
LQRARGVLDPTPGSLSQLVRHRRQTALITGFVPGTPRRETGVGRTAPWRLTWM